MCPRPPIAMLFYSKRTTGTKYYCTGVRRAQFRVSWQASQRKAKVGGVLKPSKRLAPSPAWPRPFTELI